MTVPETSKLAAAVPPRRPIGDGGTRPGMSRVRGASIPTDVLNAEWSWPRVYRTADQMFLTDPVVRAALMMVLLPVVEATWTFVPASPEPRDQAAAELARRALVEHLDWSDVLWQLLMPALRYGHGVVEEAYTAVEWELSVPTGEDGAEDILPKRTYWVPAGFAPRPGRSILEWRFDEFGALESVRQMKSANAGDTVDIPASQLVSVFLEREGGDDTGRSLLRSMYRAWFAKEKLEIIDMMRAEKAGVGVPVGTIGTGKTDADVDAFEAQLVAFGANEQGYFLLDGLPEEGEAGMKVEMLDMKAASTADILSSLRYYVEQILWSVLGAWQALGHGEVGARATAEVQDDPFYLGLRYIAGRAAKAFERQHVPRLIGYNMPDARPPMIQVADIQGADVAAVAESVAKLLAAGGIESDDALEAHLRDVFGLPAKQAVDEEEEPPEPEPEVPVDPEDDPEEDAPPPPPPPPADPGVDPNARARKQVKAAAPRGHAHPTDVWLAAYDGSSPWITREEADMVAASRRRAWSRPPTDFELANVPLAEIDATIEAQRIRFAEALRADAHAVAAHLADRDLPDEAEHRIRQAAEQALRDAANYGRMTARREAAAQTGGVAATLAERAPRDSERLDGWFTRQARRLASAIVTRLEGRADRARARETPPAHATLTSVLTVEADRAVRAEAVATVGHAFAAGRRDEQQVLAREGWTAVYSSVLDSATCSPCTSLDGQTYDVGTDEYERDYPPLAECDGGDACRCMMVLVGPNDTPA